MFCRVCGQDGAQTLPESCRDGTELLQHWESEILLGWCQPGGIPAPTGIGITQIWDYSILGLGFSLSAHSTSRIVISRVIQEVSAVFHGPGRDWQLCSALHSVMLLGSVWESWCAPI